MNKGNVYTITICTTIVVSVIFRIVRIASNIFTTLPPFLHQFRPEISSMIRLSHSKYGIKTRLDQCKYMTRKIELSIYCLYNSEIENLNKFYSHYFTFSPFPCAPQVSPPSCGSLCPKVFFLTFVRDVSSS